MDVSPPIGVGLTAARTVNDNNRNTRFWVVRGWLVACCGLVFSMVVLGGLTRLTHSGLSMVEWNPLTILPPLSDQEWLKTFSLYQTSPEFRQINPDMDVSGFKSIFWLEYLHRLVGRLTGFVFAIPLVIFWAKGMLPQVMGKRLILIFGLGALQGLIGWLMVASGLVDQPQVSHFRLAAHLLMALLIYSALVWTVLDLSPIALRPSYLSRVALLPLILVFGTITWGAFVAGLHAGLIYDTFPLMNGQFFPEDGLALHPILTNFVENLSTVQFTHRLLAGATVLSLTTLWLFSRSALIALPALWSWVQGSLGVFTLLFHVPVPLAALHQAGAVILLTLILRMVHRMHT